MAFVRLIAVLILAAMHVAAWSQSYPDKSKPIKIIVPAGPGSATDLLARALGRGMEDAAGVKVIVDNKPGAEGAIGMRAAKLASPDGYTIVLASSSFTVLAPRMQAKPGDLGYDPVTDFVPVTGVAKFTLLMNVGSTVAAKSAREFIELARQKPGAYNYGSATQATRLAAEMLEQLAQIKLVAVPYKSLTDAAVALSSGDIQLLIADAATMAPFFKSGRVRALASTGSARLADLPHLPTLQEEGVANYDLTGWFAAYFPAGTPASMVTEMQDLLGKAARSSHFSDALKIAHYELLGARGDQVTSLLRADTAKWEKLLQARPN